MNIVTVNGINLAYVRRGKGTPLVLIHGFPLDHTSWDEVASLLENEFDVITPDLRGFGQSTTVETPYTVSSMADDLAGLLDHLGIEKVALAGHSMGGYVALAFAKKYPQRVSGLGLISSQAAADSPERKEGRYKTADDVAQKGVGVVAEAMTSKLSAVPRVQAFVRTVIEKQSQSAIIGALKAMAEREDFTSFLSPSAFAKRVVLIHGNADVLIPIERANEIKAVLPSARFIKLQGAGHMPMMEFANETADGLRSLMG
jgi:pimeloyl-ACP methyl ester carboxylesterase